MQGLLPYGRQTIEDDDVAAVVEALKSDFLTTGPRVGQFEAEFAASVGAKYAVVSANGTTALHLAALAVGIGAGDWAISPSLTFLSTANSYRFCGGEVLFADCDATSALTGPEHLEAALDRAGKEGRTVRAISVVHMNGQACDMDAIGALARSRGVRLIEDSCHAIGTSYRTTDGAWHRVGACAHSDLACFSLHPLKTLTMGEGGVTTTNDPEMYELMSRLRTHGMVRDPVGFQMRELGFDDKGEPNPWYYEMPELGFNYRATDLQCALGMSQLKKLDRFTASRSAIAQYYDDAFRGFGRNLVPFKRVSWCKPTLHLYVVLLDYEGIGKSRGQVMRELRAKGVGTQVHYLPVHRQPYYAGRYGVTALPGADAYYDRALSIPLYPAMTTADANRVVAALRDVVAS